MPSASVTRIAGDRPLVLVAPHGGRRDSTRDPWDRGGLRTNDLHTADLTVSLARATGAAAVVNDRHDRNRVDLNRLDQVAERMPVFLDAIHDAVARAVERHGHVTLLTVHGWNTTAPVVDVGLGCRPGRELAGERPGPAVSPAFATRAVPAFRAACARRGVDVSIGRRYPARAPQNLIQLFTGRWTDDARDAVARVARFAPRCDAMQLEIGIPLRWPGPRRSAFVDAVREATPALLDPTLVPPGDPPAAPSPGPATVMRRLEFVSEDACGLVALDSQGGRLLVAGLHAGLDLFTHDRLSGPEADAVGALSIRPAARGADVAYRGPIGRFRDLRPFLDLEAGLADATVVEAEVALAFQAAHPADAGCPFGDLAGRIVVDGRTIDVRASAFCPTEDAAAFTTWLDLGTAGRIALRGAEDDALICHGDHHRHVRWTVATDGPGTTLVLEEPAACRHELTAEVAIPIVRGRARPATSVSLVAYRSGGRRAGWGRRSERER